MSGSREDSPDWLHSYQVPTHPTISLSSGSGSLQDGSPTLEDKIEEQYPKSIEFPEDDKNHSVVLGESDTKSSSRKTSKRKSSEKRDMVSPKKKKMGNQDSQEGCGKGRKVVNRVNTEKNIKPEEPFNSVWAISSDSESCHDQCPTVEDHVSEESCEYQKSQIQEKLKSENAVPAGSKRKSPSKNVSKEKPSKKENIQEAAQTKVKWKKLENNLKEEVGDEDMEGVEEESSDKHIEAKMSSSQLPLVLSDKVHRSKALIECEGDSIDLSGDVGVVGRVVISDSPSGNDEMYLDLKGTIYKTAIIPSRTFCIVSFGQSEAKVEAIMNDFIQLKPQSNMYEAETMVEGTLDGFSFDSDDEADKIPKTIPNQTDRDEHLEGKSNGKSKEKAARKPGVTQKRGKSAGVKPQPMKKVRKKTQGSKKGKAKK